MAINIGLWVVQALLALVFLFAGGLVIIMTGATVITAIFMDAAQALVPLTIGILSAGVAFGRWRLAGPAGAAAASARQSLTAFKPAEA